MAPKLLCFKYYVNYIMLTNFAKNTGLLPAGVLVFRLPLKQADYSIAVGFPVEAPGEFQKRIDKNSRIEAVGNAVVTLIRPVYGVLHIPGEDIGLLRSILTGFPSGHASCTISNA